MMTMSPGMLLFGLLDSGVAFYLVYNIAKAKFGGDKSTLARTIGTILGVLVFIVYFGVIVWFNTDFYTVSREVKMTVYLAPPVMAVLMVALVLLSQPPKKKNEPEESAEDEEETAAADEPEPEEKSVG